MADLSERTAVVTGAGTGIGRAVALRLSHCGARVALLGRRYEQLEKVASEMSGEALAISVDLRNRDAVAAAFTRIDRNLGPVHALVANAGIGGPNHPAGSAGAGAPAGAGDRWDEVVRTNLDGTYHSIRAFERHLAPGPAPRHAVVISSCLARFGVAGYTAYCASKAGLLGLVRALALEWADRNVLVNAICPGWVETEMARTGMQAIADETGQTYEEARREAIGAVPLGRIGQPEEIAGLVEFLLSPEAVSFTGQALDPNGGSWMG